MNSLRLAGLLFMFGLVGCSEWRTVSLHNPTTRTEAVCATQRGTLTPEQAERLRECVEACQERGFVLTNPEEMPAARDRIKPAAPPSIPLACQGALKAGQ